MKQQSFWNIRIPTILALFLILIGIGVTSFLTKKGIIFKSGAAPNEVPTNVRISNTTDTTFTVTYTTETPTLGSLSFGKEKMLGTVLLDDRDQPNGSLHAHTVHSMTAKNLLPNTTYYFSVTSGDTTYMNNNIPFATTTGPPITAANTLQKVISGHVVSNGTNVGSGSIGVGEVLVYVQTTTGQVLSTIANSQGAYTISLATLRTSNLATYVQLTNTDVLILTVTDGTATSHVTTTLKDASTIPAVILSQNYDFTKTANPSGIPSGNETNFIEFPAFSPITALSSIPVISVPKNNEAFTDSQPQFSGIAKPNSKVTILIHSADTIQTEVTANTNGRWIFRPNTPLSSGNHTISITAFDQSGILKTITQSFTIFAAGTQVFQTATPSATLTPTQVPIPSSPSLTGVQSGPTNTPITTTSPSVTPTATGAITPTIQQITTTPTNTPSPTITPTNAPILIPSPTKPPLPSTGNQSIFTIGVASIITTIIGIGLFFLTRGGAGI